MEGFVNRIDDLLLKKGMTRNNLTTQLGIAEASFRNWKNRGAIPAADVALKIAQYFDVSVEYLLTGEEKEMMVAEPAEQYSADPLNGLSDKDRELILQLIHRLKDEH